jgi:uncharacterized protein (DUF1697 family)
MPQFVAFLRGINVGGNVIVPMAKLKDLFEEQGFKNTRTLLQSGNVVFEAGRTTATVLAKKIETMLAERFARDIRVVVRTPAELANIVASNPFSKAAADDPSHLVVFFLEGEPAASATKALAQLKPAERFRLEGAHLFVHYDKSIGTSKFTGSVIEKALAKTGTARNWNTINKLIALAAGLNKP